MPVAYFDLKETCTLLEDPNNPENRDRLIALFVLLSPRYLLQLPPANDSNELNKGFYEELLYIVGLHEVERSGKKLIERLPDKQRQAGSFMEQVLKELGRRPSFLNSEGIALYGQTAAEQTFGIALELCTTWINRILFLKLLEAQLISWHNEPERAFLNIETITDFHDLSDLFFQVLNLPEDQRSATELKASLLRLPYLNSSLFEPSSLEMVVDLQLLREGNFTNVWGQTILAKDGGTVKLMPKGPLEYLFRFLNAFDFGADTETEGLKKESRTLINAPVLGLIFEKINGYKDGSFYTPSFVTMYMCRESIRRAIVQKVNQTGKVTSVNYDDLRSKIRRKPTDERKELAKVVERITICDPAAGSGHFLVSALNETIFALSDLYLLFDDNGKELGEDGESIIVAENDELIVTDRFNKLVRYEVKEEANGVLVPSQKAAAIQRGLFQIKRRLIENSLFGVDINPNSVQICRLRLWIELLKSAYYNDSPESDRFGKLETLPNLELNVQIGNSLISKFKTTVKLSEALKDTKGPDGKPLTTKNYRENVRKFRKATDKEHKERLKESIDASRNLYKEIQHRNVMVERSKKEGNVEALKNLVADGAALFEMDAKERKIRTKQLKDAEKELADFIEQTEETEKGRAFVKAFEWRYEIPEILDDAGNFIGFDVVVANPPYMRIQEIKKTQDYLIPTYQNDYKNAQGSFDLANIFFERAQQLCAATGTAAFIMPHKFLNSDNATGFREQLMTQKPIFRLTHFGANMVFGGADTYTAIVFFNRKENENLRFRRIPLQDDFANEITKEADYLTVPYERIQQNAKHYGNNQWILFDQEAEFEIFRKIYSDCLRVSEVFQIFVGLQTSLDKVYIGNLESQTNETLRLKFDYDEKTHEVEKALFRPMLMGRDVHRYDTLDTDRWVFFPYAIEKDKANPIHLEEIEKSYPLCYKYLKAYEKPIKARESGKARKLDHWYRFLRENNLTKFDQPKLSCMMICTNHPNVTYNPDGVYHTTKVYSLIKNTDVKESYLYFMAITNSSLMWWYLNQTGDTLRGDARTMTTNYLNPFPFPRTPDPQLVSEIETRVQHILNRRAENHPTDLEEREVDDLVCTLYGLTDSERALLRNDEEAIEAIMIDG